MVTSFADITHYQPENEFKFWSQNVFYLFFHLPSVKMVHTPRAPRLRASFCILALFAIIAGLILFIQDSALTHRTSQYERALVKRVTSIYKVRYRCESFSVHERSWHLLTDSISLKKTLAELSVFSDDDSMEEQEIYTNVSPKINQDEGKGEVENPFPGAPDTGACG